MKWREANFFEKGCMGRCKNNFYWWLIIEKVRERVKFS
jgi:hypothetical protein